MRSMEYASKLKSSALARGVCIYTYLGGTPSIWELWAPSMSPGGANGNLGGGGASSGADMHVSMGLEHGCGLLARPFWNGRLPSIRFSQTIAGHVSIAAITFLCPGKTTSIILPTWTSKGGVLIKYCMSSSAALENPPLAFVAIFNWRCISDLSLCTRPSCLAIVADMLKT